MKTLIYYLAFLLLIPVQHIFGQDYLACQGNCLTVGTFTNTCATPVTVGSCATWSGSCSGWTISHGAPQQEPNLSWSALDHKGACVNTNRMTLTAQYNGSSSYPNQFVGNGILTDYPFTENQTYDIRIIYNDNITFGIQGHVTNGTLNLYAATTVPHASLTSCMEPQPQPLGVYQLIKSINITAEDKATDLRFTYTPTLASYGKFWISLQGVNNSTPAPLINMSIYSVFICPACPSQTVYYNTGSVPASTSAGTIYAGTSTIDQGSGSGTVTAGSATATSLVAGNFIELDPNFNATVTGTGSVSLSIAPCYSLANAPRPDGYDSTEPTNPIYLNPVIESVNSGDTLNEKLVTMTNPLPVAVSTTDSSASSPPATKLLVYPTVSTGAFTITGSAADLDNANIIVADQSGRIVYNTYNAAGTTLSLDLGNLANGLYFLQIRQAAKTITQKIIISK